MSDAAYEQEADTVETTSEVEAESDVLGMSDAEFLSAGGQGLEYETEAASVESETEATDDDTDAAQAATDGSTEATDDSADDTGSREPSSDDDAEGESADAEEDAPTDFEAEYKKLTAPFRANNKDMQVSNVDDAIKLMQMGANYNRKMAAMKPGLKVLKLLEKHKLMDESKLSYLIDLDSKNPEAIKKLLKDSAIDPMDLAYDSDDSAEEYTAPNRGVSESELELESVIEELRDNPHYSKTLEVVGSAWDEKSKQIVADEPNLLRVINDHVARGIYDLVSTEVERERMFGRIDGSLSDIEAYRITGDAMDARGAFAHLNSDGAKPAVPTTPKQVANKDADDQARRAKRKAAGPTKPAAAKADANADFNPLALSDEAFMQQMDSRLM